MHLAWMCFQLYLAGAYLGSFPIVSRNPLRDGKTTAVCNSLLVVALKLLVTHMPNTWTLLTCPTNHQWFDVATIHVINCSSHWCSCCIVTYLTTFSRIHGQWKTIRNFGKLSGGQGKVFTLWVKANWWSVKNYTVTAANRPCISVGQENPTSPSFYLSSIRMHCLHISWRIGRADIWLAINSSLCWSTGKRSVIVHYLYD